MSTVITSIDHRSPAQRAGTQVGEKLLRINDHEIIDVLDYRFYGYDSECCLVLGQADGSERQVQIRKSEGQDLGLNFDTYLMDEMRPCSNHCIFCFVDQMPPNMRQSLYFKDDDARLSFLLGNYITLTNISPREAQRIMELHNLDEAAAMKEITTSDKERGNHYFRYTDLKWGKAQNYDVCINSALMGIDKTVEMLADLAQIEER